MVFPFFENYGSPVVTNQLLNSPACILRVADEMFNKAKKRRIYHHSLKKDTKINSGYLSQVYTVSFIVINCLWRLQ